MVLGTPVTMGSDKAASVPWAMLFAVKFGFRVGADETDDGVCAMRFPDSSLAIRV
jgi:hypothetical protein